MDVARYRDRVHGCWLGKSVGGTIGGPLEGNKDFLDVPLRFPERNIENDDLDLQLVWLHLLREKGWHGHSRQAGRALADYRLNPNARSKAKTSGAWLRLSAQDFAQAWLEHITYPWDEYGVAIANLRMGLTPPLSGHYNNWFKDCMGAPIRSEIWGVLFPGRPATAGYCAYLDAQVDHWDEGVYGEVFLACLESLAFVEPDVRLAIARALEFLPSTSQVTAAVEFASALAGEGRGLREARDAILDRFGRHNFTHCVQNIGFTVLGLLYGDGGFLKTIVAAARCGYDVDCTAATAGAILGILLGRERILEEAGVMLDERIAVGWGVRDCEPPTTLEELTAETVGLGQAALAEPSLPAIAKPFVLPEVPAFTPPCRFPFLVSPPVPLNEAEARAVQVVQGEVEGSKEVLFDGSYFDLRPFLTGETLEALFLATNFEVTQRRALKVFPAATEGIRLWLDGALVLSWEGVKPFLPAPHRPGNPLAQVEVEAGWHRVVVEVVAQSSAPEFGWIVTDEKNHHVIDLKYSARP